MRRLGWSGIVVMLLAAETAGACCAQAAETGKQIRSVGKWLNQPVIENWQSSDLSFDPWNKCLWSISGKKPISSNNNQSASVLANSVYRIELPKDGVDTASATPVEIRCDNGDFAELKQAIKNVESGLEFKGLVADPTRKDTFYACTEGEKPVLLSMEYDSKTKKTMNVRKIVRIATSGIFNNDDLVKDQYPRRPLSVGE